MKNLIKIVLSIIFLFNCFTVVHAEKLPEKYHNGFNPTDNPVWYKYMSDYRDQLYGVFEPNKFREKKWGHIFIYTINRDGKITNMIEYDTLDKTDKYIRQVILDNPPPPFPKEVEENEVRIETSLWSSNYDGFSLYYFPPKLDISIIKNHKHKHKTNIKWKPEDDEFNSFIKIGG